MTYLRTWWLVVAAALAGVAASTTADSVTGEVVYFGAYAAICAAAWWAALRPSGRPSASPSAGASTRRTGRSERWPWPLIAVGQTLLLVGDAAAAAFWYISPETDPTGWIDAPWLAGYAAIGVAIMMMARRRAQEQLREPLLDMLTLTSAASLGLWRLMVAPALKETGGLYTTGIVLEASYMVGDVLIMAAVLLLALSPGVRGASTYLMIAAGSCRIVADVWRVLLQDSNTVLLMNGVVLFGNALMVIAVMRPDRAELIRPGRRTRTLHPARIVFLGLALLTAPAIAVAEGSGSSGERMALLVATVAASCFVLSRFTVAVRQQERAERLLTYQASYDPLTGLANRRTLFTHLEDCATGDALFYLDLDGFKAVNDTHGHEAGDALLVEIGRRLRAAVREEDLVVRLGGDEFALLCPQAASHEELAALAERLLEVVAEPVSHNGHELRVGTSVGVAVFDQAATSPGDLVRNADAAMYQAKRGGRGRWVLAGPTMGGPSLALAG
ncbi:GGDEF domain-containing protein [Planomonospora sp. ID67723]|uniref:GGDEF domain-containing protein n=1 Tax=Planomonospora sp. ID67723 TaxID=2738134 RepID=UPI0018C3A48A|nr:GGDEF domain-containing protein [Planomonospora sp. ID67723]MBG0833281.1 GGDEF domain-containing protein [Planomonospora sp. ID67723]